ncbi:hypothetical protein [Nonomuraea monospora]
MTTPMGGTGPPLPAPGGGEPHHDEPRTGSEIERLTGVARAIALGPATFSAEGRTSLGL